MVQVSVQEMASWQIWELHVKEQEISAVEKRSNQEWNNNIYTDLIRRMDVQIIEFPGSCVRKLLLVGD